jgi:integrase
LTEESKNLAAVEEERKQAGIKPPLSDQAAVKGLIAKFLAWMEAEGYPKTNTYPTILRVLVSHGANLLDPESVKRVIGKRNVSNGTKVLYTYAYDAFCKMQKLSWEKPKYTQEETLPFVPDETELDMLIAGCRSRRMSTFLQTLKETYADPGEALRLRWIDISGNTITINKPVKGHLPRQLQVSNRLIAMLNSLPKTSESIFATSYGVMAASFEKTRKRLAEQHKNPRLLAIAFKSFRHWGGSMIAHYTNGNVLTVKKLLGHKRIENTMKYISMLNLKENEFEVTTATTVEEAKTILSSGFEYIVEKNGIMLFRRPKRFGSLGKV